MDSWSCGSFAHHSSREWRPEASEIVPVVATFCGVFGRTGSAAAGLAFGCARTQRVATLVAMGAAGATWANVPRRVALVGTPTRRRKPYFAALRPGHPQGAGAPAPPVGDIGRGGRNVGERAATGGARWHAGRLRNPISLLCRVLPGPGEADLVFLSELAQLL
jgi:hypothetical protein